jgi:hypothetical protein
MTRRALPPLAVLLLLAAPCGAATVCTAANLSSPQDGALLAFAAHAHLDYPDAFRRLADYLHDDGGSALPPCYLTKRAAEARGWRRGGDLWSVAPGAAIGGYRFANREGALPREWNGRYVEADLDYAGGHRGIRRLVFVRGMGERWLIFVTADHEASFLAFVPSP